MLDPRRVSEKRKRKIKNAYDIVARIMRVCQKEQ
jgi:hypothetical protein